MVVSFFIAIFVIEIKTTITTMTQKVYILRCDWYVCGESGHDNIAVYNNKPSAIKALKNFVENEKDISLTDFFYNGELLNMDNVDDLEVRDDYFLFTTKCGEYNIEVSIEVFDVTPLEFAVKHK